MDIDTFHGPRQVHSVGWLFKEDDEGITIVACFDNKSSQSTSNAQFILKSCITARKDLHSPIEDE